MILRRKWSVYTQKILAGERGQSLVEFVLILPILLIFMSSVADFGWIMLQKSNLDALTSVAAQSVMKEDPAEAEQFVKNYIDQFYPEYDLAKMSIAVEPKVEEKKYFEYLSKGPGSSGNKFFEVPMYYKTLTTKITLSYEISYLSPWGKLLFSDSDNSMTITSRTAESRVLENDSRPRDEDEGDSA